MPSRRDLFADVEAILLRAGIKKVWRGPFFPKDHGDTPMDAYPIASYHDTPHGARAESGSMGFRFLGEVQSWIWVPSGVLPGPLVENPGALADLDDMHDAIMDQLSDAYRGEQAGGILTSQISIYPSAEDYWDPNWYSLETHHLGAVLTLRYEINYAPKPHS